jgi:hypothetical protein
MKRKDIENFINEYKNLCLKYNICISYDEHDGLCLEHCNDYNLNIDFLIDDYADVE